MTQAQQELFTTLSNIIVGNIEALVVESATQSYTIEQSIEQVHVHCPIGNTMYAAELVQAYSALAVP